MKKLKWSLPMAFIFLMLFCLTSAMAESGTDGNISWVLSGDGTLTISGTGPMNDYSYNNAPWGKTAKKIIIQNGVTSIGKDAFYNCRNLTNITIPDSMISIGNWAFYGCSDLTSIMIPDLVTSISEGVFYNCSSLSNITIPDDVTSIGIGAFYNCSSLTSITIPENVSSIHHSAFDGCSSLMSIVVSNGNSNYRSIDGVLYNASQTILVRAPEGKTSIMIPESVNNIGEWAFKNCSSLTSITLPDSVTSIGFSAFSGCRNLTNITIPDNVTSIGGFAFQYCGITSITIPDGITSLGGTFEDCRFLTNVTIPDSVTAINNYTFNGCTSLTCIVLPDSVTKIGQNAFSRTGLTSVNIPNGVTSIGYQAFCNCSNLTSITIPSSVTSMDNQAFIYCSNLSDVTVLGSNTQIGDATYMYCADNLTMKVVQNSNAHQYARENKIPFTFICSTHQLTEHPEIIPTCTDVGIAAYWSCGTCALLFSDANALTALQAPIEIPALGHNLVHHDLVVPTYLEDGSEEYWSCSNCECLFGDAEATNMILEPPTIPATGIVARGDCGDNLIWKLDDQGTLRIFGTGAMYDYDERYINSSPWGTEINHAIISDGVTSIGAYAFVDCTSLRSITIPDSVSIIGNVAFSRCSLLSSPTLPAGLSSIGGSAFYCCTNFGNITIPNGTAEIGPWAFAGCSNLMSITIPESVISIGSGAFAYCDKLESIIVPNCYAYIYTIGWNSKLIVQNHTLEDVAGEQPTCTEKGYMNGTRCTICGLDNREEIAPLGHDWSNPVYVWSSNNSTVAANHICSRDADHQETENVQAISIVTLQPTCLDMGVTTYTATFNNPTFTLQTKTETNIPALGHNMTRFEATDTTCTEEGSSAYYTCGNCGKYFSDEDGLAEIEENSWIIPAAGHTMTATAAKAATCTEPGNSAYWKCTVCNKYFSDEAGETEIEENSWIIPANGHTMTATAAKAATCTEPGNSAYWKCTVCNKYFSDEDGLAEIEENSWIIPATGHTMTATAAKVATCTEPGNSAYWKCTVCNKYFSDEAGETEIEENFWIIPANGHTMTATAAKAATCTEPGNSAYWKCIVCNKYFSDADGETEIEENSWIIPANGHSWNAPTYAWTDDNLTVTATRTCQNGDHPETESMTTSRELVTAPTNKEAGIYQIVSIAFENPAFEVQTKDNLPIPALETLNVLKLPAFLKMIETKAFEGIAAEAIIIPDGCTTIEPKAFINCKNLLYIRIPAGIEIPENAFTGCPNVVIDQR